MCSVRTEPAFSSDGRYLAFASDRPTADDPSRPRHLDPAALQNPSLALANAQREALSGRGPTHRGRSATNAPRRIITTPRASVTRTRVVMRERYHARAARSHASIDLVRGARCAPTSSVSARGGDDLE